MVTNAVKLTNWNGALRSDRGGVVDATIRFERRPAGTREAMITALGGTQEGIVYVDHLPDDRISLGYIGPGLSYQGEPGPIEYGRDYHLNGWLDPKIIELDLFLDDRLYLVTYYEGGTQLSFGTDDRVTDPVGLAPFSGAITAHPVDMGLCDGLRRAAD